MWSLNASLTYIYIKLCLQSVISTSVPYRALTVRTLWLPASVCGAPGVRCIVSWNIARKTLPSSSTCSRLQWWLLEIRLLLDLWTKQGLLWHHTEICFKFLNVIYLRLFSCGFTMLWWFIIKTDYYSFFFFATCGAERNTVLVLTLFFTGSWWVYSCLFFFILSIIIKMWLLPLKSEDAG